MNPAKVKVELHKPEWCYCSVQTAVIWRRVWLSALSSDSKPDARPIRTLVSYFYAYKVKE